MAVVVAMAVVAAMVVAMAVVAAMEVPMVAATVRTREMDAALLQRALLEGRLHRCHLEMCVFPENIVFTAHSVILRPA